MTNRLVLGTVQLGLSYGINNKTKKPNFQQAHDLVKAAVESGVYRFDTAQSYGDSEDVLGRIFNKISVSDKVKVFTKLRTDIDLLDAQVLRKSVDESLLRLGVPVIEGLLLHNEDGVAYWSAGLQKTLCDLVAEGKVRSIGVSCYSSQKALEALDMEGIDQLQVPANILDRRFDEAGVFKKAKENGKTIYIRSIFLQGLLLMSLNEIPAHMTYAAPYVKRLDSLANQLNLSRQQLAFMYVREKWPDAFLIFGAETAKQVMDNILAFSNPGRVEFDEKIFEGISENVLNPSLWPKI